MSQGMAKSVAGLAFSFVCFAALLGVRPASAIPIFAQQYGVTCEKCHSVIPELNEFGADFVAFGYRIPGVKPGPAFPLAGKVNLVASSANQGPGSNGAGLPKAIVDEIELFTAGAIGSRAAYYFEQYVVDGGEHGLMRDAWVNDRLNPWQARIPVYLQAGSFTLPLPVDPESFRESYQGYALFTQSVGSNTFNFFDPKIGVRLSVGDPLRGFNAQIFAGPGHDRQSGLPTTGTDTMLVAQDAFGAFVLTGYRYAGVRPMPDGTLDRFDRIGYAVVDNQWGRLVSETVMQTGWDSRCGSAQLAGCASSGGFTQLRYELTPRLYILGRYEGTQDITDGFLRDGVLLLGYGLGEDARLTVEEVLQNAPSAVHLFNVQFTKAI